MRPHRPDFRVHVRWAGSRLPVFRPLVADRQLVRCARDRFAMPRPRWLGGIALICVSTSFSGFGTWQPGPQRGVRSSRAGRKRAQACRFQVVHQLNIYSGVELCTFCTVGAERTTTSTTTERISRVFFDARRHTRPCGKPLESPAKAQFCAYQRIPREPQARRLGVKWSQVQILSARPVSVQVRGHFGSSDRRPQRSPNVVTR